MYNEDFSTDQSFEQFQANQEMTNHLKQVEKKKLTRYGFLVGSGILLFTIFQNIFGIIMAAFGLYDLFSNNYAFQTGFSIIISIVSILASFAIVGSKMNKMSNEENVLNLQAPRNKKDFVLAIFGGIGVCMIANIVTSYITMFMSLFGVKLTTPEILTPNNTFEFIVSLIQVGVVAALVEELALRGFVMGNLKQYGMKFCVFISALIFGIIHCNLVQAPFALIVGIALGYLAIVTGSLWTAIIIHFINNVMATIFSNLLEVYNEGFIMSIYSVYMWSAIIVGVVCFVLLKKSLKQQNIKFECQETPKMQILTFKEMVFAFLRSPAMIVSLLILCYYTSSYVTFG